MNYKEFYQSKKYYLKGLAKQIHELKLEFKETQRQNRGEGSWKLWSDIQKIKYEYRHQHIAKCLNGKLKGELYADDGCLNDAAIELYNKIESTVRENNEPNFDYIKRISKEYSAIQEVHDETLVCVDAE